MGPVLACSGPASPDPVPGDDRASPPRPNAGATDATTGIASTAPSAEGSEGGGQVGALPGEQSLPRELSESGREPADEVVEPAEPVEPDEPAPSGEAPPARSCAGRSMGEPGRRVVSLQHAGVARQYILHVPSSYAGDEPVPLVLYFHPILSNALAAELGSGFPALADREGFLVAFPESQQSAAWNAGVCCTASRDVDDVGFARAVVADVSSQFCLDERRVYASGFSMGGGMAHHLGCEAADVFAAVAPGAFDLLAENPCNPVRPISVISFRSTSDAIVPYRGGRKTSAPNGFVGVHTFEGAIGSFERWAEADGCRGQPVDQDGGCQTHEQCDEGVEVTLCTVPGGHTWPDAERAWQGLSRFALP